MYGIVFTTAGETLLASLGVGETLTNNCFAICCKFNNTLYYICFPFYKKS